MNRHFTLLVLRLPSKLSKSVKSALEERYFKTHLNTLPSWTGWHINGETTYRLGFIWHLTDSPKMMRLILYLHGPFEKFPTFMGRLKSSLPSWASWRVSYFHGLVEEFPTIIYRLKSSLPSWTGWRVFYLHELVEEFPYLHGQVEIPYLQRLVEEFPTLMNRLKSSLPSSTSWRVPLPSWTGWRFPYLYEPVE
jgi:hypothetical protein